MILVIALLEMHLDTNQISKAFHEFAVVKFRKYERKTKYFVKHELS